MRKVTLFFFFIFAFGATSFAQIRFDLQLGGANFLGASLNTSFDIPLSKDKKHRISPGLGVGHLVPDAGYAQAEIITRFDLHYHYQRWGIGSELAGFMASPFSKSYAWGGSEFVDLLFYPNINHSFPIKEDWYFKVSAGVYFAYSKRAGFGSNSNEVRFSYEGDPIPGVGLNFGRRF